jgi:hypothetical protein
MMIEIYNAAIGLCKRKRKYNVYNSKDENGIIIKYHIFRRISQTSTIPKIN